MATNKQQATVEALLDEHGQTYAAEAGIRLDRNTPAPLFQLLCLSLLSSARISADIAMAAAKALTKDGLTTPKKMVDATWEHRTKVLNRSGYARYDESTSRYLADTADLLLERYDGDLRQLRDKARGKPTEAERLLTEFKGIGQAGAGMFLREAQVVWNEFAPFLDDRTRRSANEIGLPKDPKRLRELVSDDKQFVELVAALVRASIAGDTSAILDMAKAS